jgi:aminopeptidase N
MGDDAFRRTLSHYLHENAFKPVGTQDFMKAIKEATGQNMDGFIEQWILRPGHPIFDVSYTWDETTQKLLLSIRQTQDTSGDIPVYRTPVAIGVHTASGKMSKTFWIDEKEESLEMDVDSKPLMVRFDEGNYLLKEWTFKKSTDELLYQLANDDVIGRMWAATELQQHNGDPRALKALITSAHDDPFWAVRQAAVTSVGHIAGKDHIAVLREVAADKNSKVRVAALQALGDTGDAALVGFYKERFRSDDSYRAQAEALRSMGKTGDGATKAFLEDARGMKSPRNVIRRAADEALKQLQ